jgi:hypothetical protein
MIGFTGMVVTFPIGMIVGALLQIAAAYIATADDAETKGGKNGNASHRKKH